MNIENGKISNSQLMYLVLCFLLSMTITINFAYTLTKHNTWIAVLAGYAAALVITLIYLIIAEKFPGKNLVQINDIVFGRYLGKLISAIYIWFFFQLIIHYMYFFNSFWITYIMPETPRVAFLVMFTFVCIMAVRKGIEVIARLCFLFSIVILISVLTVTFLSIGDIKLSNLLPIFEVPFMDFIHSVHIILAIPFLDIVVFLMILPYTENKRKVMKPVLLGVSISASVLLLVVLLSTTILGVRLPIMASATFSVIRRIDIANALTRLDILFAIIILISFFMKVTVFYYVTVLGIAQMFKLRSYIPLAVPIGALSIAIAANLYDSDMEQAYAAIYVWPFNAFICEFLLPVATIIMIGIRKLPKRKGGNCK